MNRSKFSVLIMALAVLLLISNGCKTSDEVVENFLITALSGYSQNLTTVDPDDKGLTSINLYFAIRNYKDAPGTITGWWFKIRHDIVTLVEINHNNYQDYNLTFTGDTVIPADEVNEIYVETPQPFSANALGPDKLSFDPYAPTSVLLEVEVTDDSGAVSTVTLEGTYTFEKNSTGESKYNIIGQWEFKRALGGENQARQKIDFVGTKYSGKYVIYDFATNEVDETGSYTVSNYKNLTFFSNNGTQYWGEFTGETTMEGTLLIPETRRQDSQTGTWTGKKL